MSEISEAIGRAVRRMRRSLDLTQTELGERCKPPMTVQAVARLESGVVVPSVDMVYRIAAGLGVGPMVILPEPAAVADAPKRRAKR